MSDQPRDWDKELAEIDRAMGKMPAPGPQGAQGPPRPADAAAIPAGPSRVAIPAPGAPPVARRHLAGTWLKVLLAVALGVALVLWPYPKACGLQLGGYLAVIALAALTGIWAAFGTWRHRRGLGHTLAILATTWALGHALAEVLPRVGYARESRTWACTTQAPAPVRSTPVTPSGAVPTSPPPTSGAPTSGAPTGTAPAR